MLSPVPPPPSRRQTTPISLNQIVISNQAIKQNTPLLTTKKADSRKQINPPPILEQTQPRRTNPVVWCGAVLCLVFSLTLIFFGIATLIIFLVVKPRNPQFDTANARLNAVYFDSPEYFNGDFTFLANFSNPNHKLDVSFEFSDIELFFSDRLIARKAIKPFHQRRGEARLESVHMISSLVYLPRKMGEELQRQLLNNRVVYSIRATFRVRASFGVVHYSYWLHSKCQLELTGPPTGVLVARTCRTKR